jgi:hypothetical protein
MRSQTIAAPLLMLLALCSGKAWADAREDAAELDTIIADIEKLVPAGWTVVFEVKNDRCGSSRPKIVISSTEKLPVEYMGPGKSGNRAIDTASRKVAIDITFVPYMTPADRAKAQQQNQELERQRRHYEETRLNQRQSSYKGGFTPTTYQWQTGDKSPIIREYALFWLNTEPQPLPSHHCGRFSIHTFDLDTVTNPMQIHDERRAKEFDRIVDGLKKLFVPYESEP